MEAMSAGLPVVCFNIRGNTELIENNKGGFITEIDNIDDFKSKISKLSRDKLLRSDMSLYNQTIISKYDKGVVLNYIKSIYEQIL